MKVINLWAGPGAGKSSLAADLFAQLKWAGANAEIVREWIKEKVWQGSYTSLSNQLYVFAKQQNGLHSLNGKVEFAITDSPLPLSIIYNSEKDDLFNQLVMKEFNKFDNINLFVKRRKAYNPSGRLQTETEANELDNQVLRLLNSYNIPYQTIEGTHDTAIWFKNSLLVAK
ncbi:MAG: AAA family ATPase [Candidatus Pacearchaeota archaeon]